MKKEQVLNFLLANLGSYISGENIARRLNISRSAINKIISTLRGDGYSILAKPRKGYCLDSPRDVISKLALKELLDLEIDIEIFDEINSTNVYTKSIASESRGNKLIIANFQSEGKGRLNRPFFSPKGSGVYFSILLKEQIKAEESIRLTTAAAVSIALSLEETLKEPLGIKWVNDIYLKEKKVCGILTEGSLSIENGYLNYAIIGIGVNIYPPQKSFPFDIQNTAGSIFQDHSECINFKNKLVANITNKFFNFVRNLHDEDIFKEYKKRLFILGKEVFLKEKESIEKVIVKDIKEDFSLAVFSEEAGFRTLQSGEISLVLGGR